MNNIKKLFKFIKSSNKYLKSTFILYIEIVIKLVK